MNCLMQRDIEGNNLSTRCISTITDTTSLDNVSLSNTLPIDVLSLLIRVNIGIQGIAPDISVAAIESMPSASRAEVTMFSIVGITVDANFSALSFCQTSAEPATCRRRKASCAGKTCKNEEKSCSAASSSCKIARR